MGLEIVNTKGEGTLTDRDIITAIARSEFAISSWTRSCESERGFWCRPSNGGAGEVLRIGPVDFESRTRNLESSFRARSCRPMNGSYASQYRRSNEGESALRWETARRSAAFPGQPRCKNQEWKSSPCDRAGSADICSNHLENSLVRCSEGATGKHTLNIEARGQGRRFLAILIRLASIESKIVETLVTWCFTAVASQRRNRNGNAVLTSRGWRRRLRQRREEVRIVPRHRSYPHLAHEAYERACVLGFDE